MGGIFPCDGDSQLQKSRGIQLSTKMHVIIHCALIFIKDVFFRIEYIIQKKIIEKKVCKEDSGW